LEETAPDRREGQVVLGCPKHFGLTKTQLAMFLRTWNPLVADCGRPSFVLFIHFYHVHKDYFLRSFEMTGKITPHPYAEKGVSL
jgi:hypothetical protein